jgi:hypothetical protein
MARSAGPPSPRAFYDEMLGRMTHAAEKLNVERVKVEDLARSGGAPEE